MNKKLILALIATFPISSYANCTLPSQLDGVSLTTLSNPLYSSVHVNAGTLANIKFDVDTYDYQSLNRKTSYTGHYSYSVVDSLNGIAILRGFKGSNLSELLYTYTFKCVSDKSGTAIYTQQKSSKVAEPKQNTFFYAIN